MYKYNLQRTRVHKLKYKMGPLSRIVVRFRAIVVFYRRDLELAQIILNLSLVIRMQ